MSEETKKAAGILAPSTSTMILVASTSATQAAVDLAAYIGCYVTIFAETSKLYVLFAATSGTADDLDDTATSGATRCMPIPSDQERHFLVPGAQPFLGYKNASGATGTIRVYKSSNRI